MMVQLCTRRSMHCAVCNACFGSSFIAAQVTNRFNELLTFFEKLHKMLFYFRLYVIV